MATVQSYRDLIVRRKAMDFVEAVSRGAESFRRERTYGLKAPLCRSALSIASNIAEGPGRATTRDILTFRSIASGSLMEVETQLILSTRFGRVERPACSSRRSRFAEAGRLPNGLIRALEQREAAT
jgi:four helix bundle protein